MNFSSFLRSSEKYSKQLDWNSTASKMNSSSSRRSSDANLKASLVFLIASRTISSSS
jgi:hypothetical protein